MKRFALDLTGGGASLKRTPLLPQFPSTPPTMVPCPMPRAGGRRSSCCGMAPGNARIFRGSAHERRAVGPAQLEADVGRVVEVRDVLRDPEAQHRRADAMAQPQGYLVLGSQQLVEIGVLVAEYARARVKLDVQVGPLGPRVFVADDRGGDDLRACGRHDVADLGIDGSQARVRRVALHEALQRDLRTDVGMSGRKKRP